MDIIRQSQLFISHQWTNRLVQVSIFAGMIFYILSSIPLIDEVDKLLSKTFEVKFGKEGVRGVHALVFALALYAMTRFVLDPIVMKMSNKTVMEGVTNTPPPKNRPNITSVITKTIEAMGMYPHDFKNLVEQKMSEFMNSKMSVNGFLAGHGISIQEYNIIIKELNTVYKEFQTVIRSESIIEGNFGDWIEDNAKEIGVGAACIGVATVGVILAPVSGGGSGIAAAEIDAAIAAGATSTVAFDAGGGVAASTGGAGVMDSVIGYLPEIAE